jgi:hypothetical protein
VGTQKLGLGSDSSTNSEDNLVQARDDDTAKFAERLFNSRFAWTIPPFGIGGLFFLMDWGGYRGKFMPWGDPRPLSEVWWHVPLWFLLGVVSVETYKMFGQKK